MKVVMFYHSILSCWNNGHAHFLRGIASELVRLGIGVDVYEPADGWSRMNAVRDNGAAILEEVMNFIPGIAVHAYRGDAIDLDRATDGADLVIVHEWNSPSLVAAIGRHRAAGATYLLLFHDSHHRSVTAPAELDGVDLDGYDGVLAFGEAIREAYLQHGWACRAFTWHEAADTTRFRPAENAEKTTDLIWIGNWGDGERSLELNTYLVAPAAELAIRTRVHGVRYPQHARSMLAQHGIDFAGWLPNHRVPGAYACARATVHIPRRAYASALPGIPTIRVFEALACGIPLISAPWLDEEGLFPNGCYIRVESQAEACAAMSRVLTDVECARHLVATGLDAIHARHTCAHRVRELLAIVDLLEGRKVETHAPDRLHDRLQVAP